VFRRILLGKFVKSIRMFYFDVKREDLSHLFPFNDICCSMYVIYVMVVMLMMMFMRLRPRIIRS
jgi:hypothetical protein